MVRGNDHADGWAASLIPAGQALLVRMMFWGSQTSSWRKWLGTLPALRSIEACVIWRPQLRFAILAWRDEVAELGTAYAAGAMIP